MSFSLFPKSPKFFQLFLEQNRIIVDAATVLHQIAEEFSDCEDQCQVINRLEAEGDASTGLLPASCRPPSLPPSTVRTSTRSIPPGNHPEPYPGGFKPHWRLWAREDAVPAKKMISNIKGMVTGIGSLLTMLSRGQEVTPTVAQVKQLKRNAKCF